MTEKIYTIPINEQFDICSADKSEGCPICRLYNDLENNELELILGAAMMEPDTRIKTNEKGFCIEHYQMMLQRKNCTTAVPALPMYIPLYRISLICLPAY